MKADHPGVPVILRSDLTDPLELIRGLEAGADQILPPPHTPEHLVERVQRLLATWRPPSHGGAGAGIGVRTPHGDFRLMSDPARLADVLVTTFEDAVRQNRELRRREESLARSRRRLAGMHEIAVALNRCTTEDDVVNTSLDGLLRLPGVGAAWISLRDGASEFQLAGTRNLPPALGGPGALEGPCRCRRMLLDGQLEDVAVILECERIAATGSAGVGHHASVPLAAGGQVVGVLNVLPDDGSPLEEQERVVLYGIGSQIGDALARARSRRQLEVRVSEGARELTESEERFRALVTAVNDGIFVTDGRGVITFANPALARIHGVAGPSELEGRAFTEFLPEGMKAELTDRFRTALAEGAVEPLVTTPLVRPDGKEVVVEIRPSTILRKGRAVGTRGVVRDITERIRSDEALRLSDSILNRIGDLVLVAGPEGEIRYASPSFRQILGYGPEEVLGDGWWALAWEDREAALRERAAVAGRARGDTAPDLPPEERPVRARDGTTRWFLWTESKGPRDLLIGVGHDITEHRRLREQFLQAQKMEAVGRLAGGIAHDFNNVLTSILITAEMLLPELEGDKAKQEDVQAIRSAGQRAVGLTKQLLAFSRKQVLNPRPVNLNELVEGMAPMLGSLLGEDIVLDFRLEPGLGLVEMDPTQMEQVVLNLAVNARDAMPGGGHLLLETKNVDLNGGYARARAGVEPGPYVLLEVTDDGTGMEPSVQQHIFEPFFTTKGQGKGTGLGLATVHGIVHQSGGHIWVYSEPGQGTTFKIYMPRSEGGAEVKAKPKAKRRRARGTETILLVEDDDAVRTAAERVLNRGGYTVITASRGAEALATMEGLRGRVDLLVTDVVMPDMSGPDLAAELRRLYPGLRVLFVSGYTDEVIARRGAIGPGEHFLEKPFVVDRLLARVREVLDAGPGRRTPSGQEKE
ncbi:MAG: hypothetical protein AMXMBFR53_03290 [Gemmatimonadota bacterium]